MQGVLSFPRNLKKSVGHFIIVITLFFVFNRFLLDEDQRCLRNGRRSARPDPGTLSSLVAILKRLKSFFFCRRFATPPASCIVETGHTRVAKRSVLWYRLSLCHAHFYSNKVSLQVPLIILLEFSRVSCAPNTHTFSC